MTRHLEQLSVLAQQSNGRWYPIMSEETINSIENFLSAHDLSIYEEWLAYKEEGMSDGSFTFQDRLTVGVDDSGGASQTEMVIVLSDGNKLLFTEDVSRTGLTQFATVEDEKKVLDQKKATMGGKDIKPHKVVINVCYGDASLSTKAELLLRERLRVSGYPDETPNRIFDYGTFELMAIIERHHPALVSLVEELGEEANGLNAKLVVEEIEGDYYRITEHDGFETLITPDLSHFTKIN